MFITPTALHLWEGNDATEHEVYTSRNGLIQCGGVCSFRAVDIVNPYFLSKAAMSIQFK